MENLKKKKYINNILKSRFIAETTQARPVLAVVSLTVVECRHIVHECVIGVEKWNGKLTSP